MDIIYIYLALAAFVVIAGLVWWVTPRSAQDHMDRLDADFQRRFGHLPLKDRLDLKRSLAAFAKVRRISSAVALDHPGGGMETAKRQAEIEAGSMLGDLGKNFLSVVRDSRPSEVLYGGALDTEFRSAMDYAARQKKPALSEDDLAGMRIQ